VAARSEAAGADDLCDLSAVELARRLRERAVSAVEIMQAHLARIERVNPQVNAIVTLVPEAALAGARAADAALAAGRPVGPLHGLPVAHKDLAETRGIRTTYGSPIYRDFVPDRNALLVDRLQAAGAITIGKTNTPEFGAGAQTFNPIFGPTRNPYDLSKTCGGSSGGAAVALACGMVPLADGSDLGGSLRIPASFCNVVGFRPSAGRVPRWPNALAWNALPVVGPMARTVADVALMLSVLAGPDARDPLSRAEPGSTFACPLARDVSGVRLAWSRDLGGLPVEPAVTAALDRQRPVFEALGCVVEDGEPDFSGADEVFMTLRAWAMAATLGDLLRDHRDQLKDTVIWNIEEGLRLTGPQVGRAERLRTEIYARVLAFLERYAFLVLPVTPLPPFDVSQPYPTSVAGQLMPSYIAWARTCYFITITGLPAISVPAGFTDDGLPVGVQIVGRPGDDLGVLQLAHAFEQARRAVDGGTARPVGSVAGRLSHAGQ
jgi:amidase